MAVLGVADGAAGAAARRPAAGSAAWALAAGALAAEDVVAAEVVVAVDVVAAEAVAVPAIPAVPAAAMSISDSTNGSGRRRFRILSGRSHAFILTAHHRRAQRAVIAEP